MIPLWKVQVIQSMLADDRISQREIARRLHVGRGVVAGIANGTRPDYRASQQDAESAESSPEQPVQRCGRCGAMVQLPCLACRTRSIMAGSQRLHVGRDNRALQDGLQLTLAGAERMRYEEVRARRSCCRAASPCAGS